MSHVKTSHFISCVYLQVQARRTHSNRRKLSPHTRSILWCGTTKRSFLSMVSDYYSTYPQPKLTPAYWVYTTDERAEGFLTCYAISYSSGKTYFLLNSDAEWCKLKHVWTFGHCHTFRALWGKKALLRWPWCVSKAPTVCLVCAQVIHHMRSSVVVGAHLSPLLRLNLEAGRTLHCACSILQPSGYDLTAFYNTFVYGTGMQFWAKHQPLYCDQPQLTPICPLTILFRYLQAWVRKGVSLWIQKHT